MKAHEQILKMIEEVSPDDTKTLDEIDARVAFYVGADKVLSEHLKGDETEFLRLYKVFPQLGKKYTRSRDALKAIRPEGWGFDHDVIFDKWAIVGYVTEGFSKNHPCVESYTHLPTEEIAELHAIIQAIVYERGR